MKELAAENDGTRYAQALHILFDLDPEAISQLTPATESAAEPEATTGMATYDELLGGA